MIEICYIMNLVKNVVERWMYMKKIFKRAFIVATLIALTTTTAFAANTTANKSTHKVEFNGDICAVEMYNIQGNNYLKLRDIAYMLDGSDASFDVEYDASVNAINLVEGKAYTKTGGEMSGVAWNQTATLSNDKVLKDGEPVTIKGYKIHGNNFYMLRDVLKHFDAEIDFDTVTSTVIVETDDGMSYIERQIVNLVNVERAKEGLNPLKFSDELSEVADIKAADMRDADYFDHTSPNYGSPFEMMKSFGIDYSGAGENIAMGYPTPEAVMNGWMNSQGHKENILRDWFEEIGIGYVTDERGYTYWVQMFIKE